MVRSNIAKFLQLCVLRSMASASFAVRRMSAKDGSTTTGGIWASSQARMEECTSLSPLPVMTRIILSVGETSPCSRAASSPAREAAAAGSANTPLFLARSGMAAKIKIAEILDIKIPSVELFMKQIEK